MHSAAEHALRRRLLDDLRPPERLSPSEWAERYIMVTDGERVGPLRFARGYEYQRQMLDAVFGPFDAGEALRIACAYKGAQSGVTLLCLIGLLYTSCVRGVSVAHMMPRSFDADDKAKKLAAIIDASPALRELIPPGMLRVRLTRNGQSIRVCYSSSAAELKNWQAGVGVVDEMDECESREHDSVGLFLQRMGAYRRQLQVFVGTPTLPDYGVHERWQQSDQRQWFVRCPLCDAEQVLLWEQNIRFDAEDADGVPLSDDAAAATAELYCTVCERAWDFRLRELANARGEWRATRESHIIGFGMNRLMVPTSLPEQMVLNYLRGLRSDLAMREHYNQDRGLCFLASTGKLDLHRVEQFFDPTLQWGRIPKGCAYLAAGVDTQGDAEPFSYVWDLRAYDHAGVAHSIAYGIDREERIIQLFGEHGSPGIYNPARVLIDITDGHHKRAVDRIIARCPAAEAIRCDPYRKTSFEPGKVVRIKKGGSRGYAVDEDQVLDENLSRFYADAKRGQRIRIALAPNAGLQKALAEQYTKIARIREQGPNGVSVWRYKKLRPKDVDFPHAGAFADYAHSQLGTLMPGTGGFGGVQQVREQTKQQGQAQAVRNALHIVKRRR